MGLFDSVSFGAGSQLSCAHGHALSGPFQSKSFEESGMDTYHVHEGRLFLEVRGRAFDEDASREETSIERIPDSDEHIIVTKRPLAFQALTRTLDVYTSCSRCKPVEFRRPALHGLSWDNMDHRSPWVEYSVTFIDGKLTKAIPKRLETRETVVKELKAEGLSVVEA